MTANSGDRDIIDVTTTAQGHLDWVRDLIVHRCPEIGPDNLALIGTIHPAAPSAEMLPVEIGERIVEVLDLMMGRLDEIAETIANRDEDDDDATRRRAG